MSLLRQLQLTARKYERKEIKDLLDPMVDDYLMKYYMD